MAKKNEAEKFENITLDEIIKQANILYLVADDNIIEIEAMCLIAHLLPIDPLWLCLVAPPSGGKCLGKGTKVLMYDGSIKKVEDIQKGELLMGNDSTPRKVLKLARGQEKMYKIVPEKGASYVVNEPHILSLIYNQAKINFANIQKGDVVNISVKDFLNKSKYFQKQLKGYRVGVDFKYVGVSLDPYFLGIWLGDGSNYYPSITTADKEIVSYLRSFARKHEMKVSIDAQKDRCPSYLITTGIRNCKIKNYVTEELRKYNLFQNKHIPSVYKINSRKIRLQVLAGLLDSDGHLSYNRRFQFVNKNKQLAEDTLFLAQSLGFSASMKKIRKGIKSINFVGTYYNVNISGDLHKIPTKIPRKKAKRRKSKTNLMSYGIKVQKLKVNNYYGFEIDKNKLFLLGDFTVTHNTEFLNMLRGLDYTYTLSTLTGKTLFSGAKVPGKGEGGASLIYKIESKIVMIKDLTSILNENVEDRKLIMSQLREIYDGHYNKEFGTGDSVNWEGRVSFLAGVTQAIHTLKANWSQMGERMLLYNLKQPDRIKQSIRAMENQEGGMIEAERLKLRAMMTSWGHRIKKQVVKLVEKKKVPILSKEAKVELSELSEFSTRARSDVERDWRSANKEMLEAHDPEMPGRMAAQLMNVAVSFMILRWLEHGKFELTDKHRKVVQAIALDSITKLKMKVMVELARYDVIHTSGLAVKMAFPTTTIRRALEDLNALKVISRVKESGGKGDSWKFNSQYKELMLKYKKIDYKGGTLEEADEEDEIKESVLDGDMEEIFSKEKKKNLL